MYGFSGDEEKLGHAITGMVNVAAQTGARISSEAVSDQAMGF